MLNEVKLILVCPVCGYDEFDELGVELAELHGYDFQCRRCGEMCNHEHMLTEVTLI